MDEYDDGPYWAILLMYGSHDMRHTGFRRLTVVNGTPGFWGVTLDECSRGVDLTFELISSCRRSLKIGFNCLRIRKLQYIDFIIHHDFQWEKTLVEHNR